MFPNNFCVIAFMFFNFDIDNIRVNSNNINSVINMIIVEIKAILVEFLTPFA